MNGVVADALRRLGVPADLRSVAGIDGLTWLPGNGPSLSTRSPIDGAVLAELASVDEQVMEGAIHLSREAFHAWRLVPAPRRGELVRRFGNLVREYHEPLATLITHEVGKITAEARGEIQELIDICEFAVGLSRQLHGLTIASERPGHRLMEQWHPLGPVGVITAFNFPVAVWGWNAMLALVCGDSVLWKPSEKAPLCALATQAVLGRVLAEFADAPEGLSQVLLTAEREVTRRLVDSPQVPLISATGSVAMGRDVAQRVAARLGRSLLELGGNNAAIVTPSADLELAIRSIVFGAVGTCGQRCTTLRRLIVHESLREPVVRQLRDCFAQLPIGDPSVPGTLVGPLIDERAGEAMQRALAQAREQGGRVWGGEPIRDLVPPGCYVRPALVEIEATAPIVQHETFAPILYVLTYRDFGEALAIQNGVPQGLSSAVFTNDLREAERFVSPAGSDCGLANVNTGTSGAEIGGAFGGEKETGGGRESGSDAWKNYMRRATNTINYSGELPLAQGIRFDIPR
ncbi:MAG: aldehyde dehydrogenase family protein [Planctomycetaceae bacterium]|jgi:aldehyde dehydrogenase (NAD+)